MTDNSHSDDEDTEPLSETAKEIGHIAAGGIYKFAGPQANWEAFISGKRGQERRNLETWREAARRLGPRRVQGDEDYSI